jgi:hypothetical protein
VDSIEHFQRLLGITFNANFIAQLKSFISINDYVCN